MNPTTDALQRPGFSAGAALSERIGRIAMNPIIKILNQVRAMERAGHELANFSVGEPDFETPQNIQDAAIAAMRRGETRYTTSDGTVELKEAIKRKFKRENGLDYELAQIGVGSGAKHVIYNALQCTLSPGDEVIIPAPYWSSYPEVVTFCDGTPVIVNCGREQGFRLKSEQLERAITPRTKWLILNSPSNPSGAAYGAADLKAIAEVLKRHPKVMVLSDDMYEHLLYDGVQRATIAQVSPALYERTLTVNGVSKTYAMTGWRIGYAGGPTPLLRAMANIQSQTTSNPCSISQAAAVEALNGPQDIVLERGAIFEQRRDMMVRLLNQIPGMICSKPEGAFYAYVDCTGIIGKKTAAGKVIADDTELAVYLLEQARVATVQGAGFGLSPYLRLAYATSFANIEQGCARIRRACEELR
jgi:aspartate aminotransferase